MGKRTGWVGACGLVLALALAGAAAAAPAPDVQGAAERAARAPIEEVISGIETQHPVAMLILARRLFDAGRKDEAVFWFFEGQLRWRAWIAHSGAKSGGGPFAPESETDRFNRLLGEIGPDINYYAAGDVPALVKIFDDVLAWDAAHPDKLTPPGPAKEKSRSGLKGLGAYMLAHEAEIKAQRAQNSGAPSAADKDPYAGSGGAYNGTPQEMLTNYDPATFASLEVGVATKADVVRLMGRPEFWITDKDQTSSIYYGFLMRDGDMAGLGFARRVTVVFRFDTNKVLSGIGLPDPD